MNPATCLSLGFVGGLLLGGLGGVALMALAVVSAKPTPEVPDER